MDYVINLYEIITPCNVFVHVKVKINKKIMRRNKIYGNFNNLLVAAAAPQSNIF